MDRLYLRQWQRRRIISACLLLIIAHFQDNLPQRNIWVHHWVARRKKQGCHHNLFLELQLEDPERFRRCLRMDVAMFQDLVEKVTPIIRKQNTHLRESISPAERLSVTLRHLATGESQESLSCSFRIGQSTISGIIKETVKAIHTVLAPDYLKFPQSEEEWKVVAQDYEDRWNFPNCIGAMDGKHVTISPPLKSGSMYYNYKKDFSIVLMAVVDAQLRFIYVDVGTNGRASDRGIWNKCSLKKGLENNTLAVPKPCTLNGTQQNFPYVLLGDEGFTLSEQLMLPYPKDSVGNRKDRRIFNYRLSRARRCSENAFGVMAARFQILRAPIRYDPDDVRDIVMSIVCLHNWLRTNTVGRAMYSPPAMLDTEDEMGGTFRLGDYRLEPAHALVRFVNQGGNRHADAALVLRDRFCAYFNTIGRVPWQDDMIDHQRL
ncbi:hypothetical protein FOCC_FOCC015316 [Frankliniella occidentalis]|uniref:Uncharacterized protein LOC113214694 n=1 Tax=Frankliniella occidentalis TaxID=133901 RepID=A0A9C6X6Y2_FRAOC|nr:uncharacterized protein LOC113214694 [Frankliniella occidentalis]KAE8739193.1 hypothetical protein FOCC_FOCC015316 [Frankliniella occidentalis]